MSDTKKITVCTGVGLNMFFPEYITIEIPKENDVEGEVKKITRKRKTKK